MSKVTIPDDQWSKILAFLYSYRRAYVGKEANCRRFVEGVLWIARSGAQWRLLPETYVNWNSVYKRFARWCDNQVREKMHQHFVDGSDMEHLLMDSTVILAHPCAYDKHLYKERHLVECFIGKIKHYRRVFSRFEKLAKRYLGFMSFVGVFIWLC